MLTASRHSQVTFYQRFLMGRQSINPRDFGIDMDKEAFIDAMCEDFNSYTRGMLTLDEMLLRPRAALHFCDETSHKHGYFDLPDDIILRAIMTRRKNPGV